MKTKFFFCVLVLTFVAFTVDASLFYGKKPRKNKDTSDVGLQYGINLLGVFGNKYNANFYNGDERNENKASLIFVNNPSYYRQIYELLHDTFALRETPTQMKYKVAIGIGAQIKYHFVNGLGIFVQFNYASLKSQDAITIVVAPRDYLTNQDIRLYSIRGAESRYDIDFGITKTFMFQKRLGLAVEAGFNLNNTKVKENKINIEGTDFNLVNVYLNQIYAANTQQTAYDIRQGGIGYGGFASASLRLFVNDYISIDPGGSIYYKTVNLPGYKDFKFNYAIFIRLSFRYVADLF